jgi:malonate transporter and related proteins
LVTTFWQFFRLSAPLFAVVFVGYFVARRKFWKSEWTDRFSKFVFVVLLPALLFHLMSGLSRLPPVDWRLLLAFFGGCFVVFGIGRVVASRFFRLDGVAQSVFALGGVFSNNVLLGVPLIRVTLGPAALPSVALVLVFNALILWTLVTVSVEWARHGSLSLTGFGKTARGVVTNPIVAAILLGTGFGLSGWVLPPPLDRALSIVGQIAAPGALLALGMGLAEYEVAEQWRPSLAITVIKLIVQPLVVWLLAVAIGLPPMERTVVVVLASMSVGANVYLMAAQFETQKGVIASSLVLSTALAAVTTPILLAVLH